MPTAQAALPLGKPPLQISPEALKRAQKLLVPSEKRREADDRPRIASFHLQRPKDHFRTGLQGAPSRVLQQPGNDDGQRQLQLPLQKKTAKKLEEGRHEKQTSSTQDANARFIAHRSNRQGFGLISIFQAYIFKQYSLQHFYQYFFT